MPFECTIIKCILFISYQENGYEFYISLCYVFGILEFMADVYEIKPFSCFNGKKKRNKNCIF